MPNTTVQGKHARHSSVQTDKPFVSTNGGQRDSRTANHSIRQRASSLAIHSEEVARYSRSNYGSKRKRSKKRNPIYLSMVIVLGVFFGVLGITAGLAAYEATTLKNDAHALSSALVTGDTSILDEAATSFSSTASHIRLFVDNPFWRLASLAPVVGADVAAVREYSCALDDLSRQLLMPMASQFVQTASGPLIRDDGSLNADSLQIVFQSIDSASESLTSHAECVTTLRDPSIGRLKAVQSTAKKVALGAESLVDASGNLASSIHFLLGADGSPRTYLVIAQNNSEIHATGGFIGSYGTASVDNGIIALGEFQSIWRLGRYGDKFSADIGEPPITEEEIDLFGRRIALTPGDATYTPDFCRAATILDSQVRDLAGVQTDGIISVDPVFLQNFLGVTKGVALSNGMYLDETNVATYLLHDVYWQYSTNEEQDAIFGEVASAVFASLISSIHDWDLSKLAKVVWGASGERNLLLWSARQDAEAAFEKLGFSGNVQLDSSVPVLGVYSNSGGAGKMGWYFSENTAIDKVDYEANGSSVFHVRTTISNNVSNEEIVMLPSYVCGIMADTPGHTRNWIYLVAPLGGTITEPSVEFTDGEMLKFNMTEYYGSTDTSLFHSEYNSHDVWSGLYRLGPGASVTFAYSVTLPSWFEISDLVIDRSPSAQDIAGW